MDKSSLKMPKRSILASFLKHEARSQTVLPDRSLLLGQKLLENAKIDKFNFDFLSGQKFIKNAKKVNFGEFLKTEVCCQTVLPDRSILKKTKIG